MTSFSVTDKYPAPLTPQQVQDALAGTPAAGDRGGNPYGIQDVPVPHEAPGQTNQPTYGGFPDSGGSPFTVGVAPNPGFDPSILGSQPGGSGSPPAPKPEEKKPEEKKPPTGAKPPAPGENPLNALDLVRALYPWIDKMGLTSLVTSLIVQGLSPEAIVAEIRNTPQYAQMFPQIRREDGTMRMNEGSYLTTQESYRTLMKQYGRPGSDYSDPSAFAGLFANEIDPNEFKQRLDTYSQITRLGGPVKAAFYVYAGIPLTDDDLYQAVADPAVGQHLQTRYTQAVAAAPPDYYTYISRATEIGLQQAAQNVGQYSPVTAATIQNIDPQQAMQLADTLHQGDQTNANTQFLSLDQLLHAFQASLLGGAATLNGLRLPPPERIEQFRQAGIDRSRALDVYGQIASHGEDLSGGLQRSGLGNGFSQANLEDALFMKTGTQADLLKRAQDYDKSLGAPEGGFNHGLNRDTLNLEQVGLRAGQGAL